jgi:hypothetical protein
MFIASQRITLLDDLRVPYRTIEGSIPAAPHGFVGAASAAPGREAGLWWPSEKLLAGARRLSIRLRDGRLVGRVLGDAQMAAALGGGWQALDVSAPEERTPISIWHGECGVALPFVPDEAVHSLRSEGYRGNGDGRSPTGPGRLLRTYYRVRPAVPRRVQIALRRGLARLQGPGPSDFPAWPMEPALHDLVRWLYHLLVEVAGEPVPWIAPWPAPFRWAMVLTHDVETRIGLEAIPALRAVEESLGYRSSWNFVPKRYEVPSALLQQLRDAGCEVGVHGLHHDGRDLGSAELLAQRLPEMRRYAEAWQAVGFRSPATQRSWDVVGRLGFEYDSSYPDTDPFEPQPGGCCSWLPFELGTVIELPITLPQDHTLYAILRHRDAAVWLDKARRLRDRGGMALVLTHPDYQREPRMREHYRELLAASAGDPTAWHALPREVSGWWRRRMASTLERGPDGWRVVGPATDEARVSLEAPG